jgi:hypothetical protein
MKTILFTFCLEGKKDALAARERVRQAARLLRFEPPEETLIAAATFVIAYQALRHLAQPTLVVNLEDDCLHISAQGRCRTSPSRDPKALTAPSHPPLLELVKPLPDDKPLSPEDLSWILQQVNQPRHANLFEELHQQNQEILALVHQLRQCQEELKSMKVERSNPSAA